MAFVGKWAHVMEFVGKRAPEMEFVGKRSPGIEVRDIDTSQTLIMQKFDTMHTDAYNA